MLTEEEAKNQATHREQQEAAVNSARTSKQLQSHISIKTSRMHYIFDSRRSGNGKERESSIFFFVHTNQRFQVEMVNTLVIAFSHAN